nr:T9SS type A sorting domain-containing protein [Flavobacterium sp.]
FLLDTSNTDCTGIAYYWEQDKTVNSHYLLAYQGGYGTYAPLSVSPTEYGVYIPAIFSSYNIDGTVNVVGASSGLSIQRKYAPIGQGFMIKGKASGIPVAVTLKNEHRVFYKESDTYSQFERTTINQTQNNNEEPTINPVSVIRLNTKMNNQFTKQIALVLMPTATDGIDRGIDALSPDEESIPNDVYFDLNQEKYVIQGINFDIEKRIPIGIKATNSTSFQFDASMVFNLDEAQNIFMYDAFDGSYHDIKNATYEVSLPTGIHHNRFEITFTDYSLGTTDDEIKSDFMIIQNNASQLLTVSNPKEISLKSVSLYDLAGKKIFSQQELGIELNYNFATNGLAEAVYLVEVLTSENKKVAQKIIIASK